MYFIIIINSERITSMKNKFYLFSDPKNSWLRVDRDTLEDLGLSQNDFSKRTKIDFSYLYLEENNDAPIFLSKWAKKNSAQTKLQIVERHTKKRSFVHKKYSNYRIIKPIENYATT